MNYVKNLLLEFIENPGKTYKKIFIYTKIPLEYIFDLIHKDKKIEEELKKRMVINTIYFGNNNPFYPHISKEIKEFFIEMVLKHAKINYNQTYELFEFKLNYLTKYEKENYDVDYSKNFKIFKLKLYIKNISDKIILKKVLEDLLNYVPLDIIEQRYKVKLIISSADRKHTIGEKIIPLTDYDILEELQIISEKYNNNNENSDIETDEKETIPIIVHDIFNYYTLFSNQNLSNQNLIKYEKTKKKTDIEKLIELLNKVLEEKSDTLKYQQTIEKQKNLFKEIEKNLQKFGQNLIEFAEKNKAILEDNKNINEENIKKVEILADKIEEINRSNDILQEVITKLNNILE